MNWIDEAVFYHIYPIGFCGAPLENDFSSEVSNRILEIQKWIKHFKFIGINTIYFGPIFESTSHGYDTADYKKLDRRLGSNEDFTELCNMLHSEGIRVVLDGVFNHVGRDFWAFKDVINNRQNSPYVNWFSNINFNNKSPYGDPFSYDGWEGHYNLVKLNLKNQEVRKHIFEAVKLWRDEFKIDGLRLDVAYCIDRDFLRELNSFCKSLDPNFYLLGEMIGGDYNMLARDGNIGSVTNYECYKGIYSSHNSKNYFEIAYSLNREFGDYGIYKNIKMYNFVDNHDVSRIMSVLTNPKHIELCYTLLFTMPGIPSIYYGSEFGILGSKQKGSDEVLRPKLNLEELQDGEGKTLSFFISLLSSIRKSSTALMNGDYSQLVVRNEQFAFARFNADEFIIVALNLSDEAFDMEIPLNDKLKGKKAVELLSKEEIEIKEAKKLRLRLMPYDRKIIKFSDKLNQ